MKLLESKRMTLPKVYFVSDRESISEIPPGVPFIYGDPSMEERMIRVLEYEILFQEAMKTGYPFNWRKILLENGYEDIESFYGYGGTVWMEYTSVGLDLDEEVDPKDVLTDLSKTIPEFKKFIKDSVAYVDVKKLKALNVFPVWLDTIEDAVSTNVHNFAVYNNNMYNKKLEGMFGALDLVSPARNLIIIDISGSIPRGVSSTTLLLAKNLAETFYADLLITGSKSTLYAYENLHELDVEYIYEQNGMDNDQVWFRKLVTSEEKKYKTAIIFGDNHSPCYDWYNKYNVDTRTISREDGQKMCKWEVEKIISFHVDSNTQLAGYGDWFTPKDVEHIEDWVHYLEESY